MKTAHTPGPWVVHHIGRYPEVSAANGRETIANPVNGLANAQLIASAPDLLSALEECRHALDVALCGTPSSEYFKAVKTALKIARATSIEDNLAINCQEIKHAAQVALDKVRAAIAKATGGEK